MWVSVETQFDNPRAHQARTVMRWPAAGRRRVGVRLGRKTQAYFELVCFTVWRAVVKSAVQSK